MDCDRPGAAAFTPPIHTDDDGASGGTSPASGGRHARRRARGRCRAGAGLVAVLAGLSALLFAACGGTYPTAAGGPGTATGHPTPAKLIPQLDRAIAEEQQGQSAQAVSDFLAVVKADPKDQVAWYDLGVIAQRAHQDAGAQSDYRRALAGDPTYVPALYNLAVLETPSDPRGAEQLYGKVLKLSPKDADAELNLGFALLTTGQQVQGKADLAKAIALDPAMASRVPVADGGTG